MDTAKNQALFEECPVAKAARTMAVPTVIGQLMSGHGDIALAAVGIVLKAEHLPLNIDAFCLRTTFPTINPLERRIPHNFLAKGSALC